MRAKYKRGPNDYVISPCGQMATITLTKGVTTTIDLADLDLALKFRWHASSTGDRYYVKSRVKVEGVVYTVFLHRLLLGSDTELHVDHINGDPLNNCRSNLRLCTHAENHMNRRKLKPGSSKYKGVSWSKAAKKWQVKIGDPPAYVGNYVSEETAARAYNKAALEKYGAFANLNEVVDVQSSKN